MSTAVPKPAQKAVRPSDYWQQTFQNRMLMVVMAMVVLVPLLAAPTNLRMMRVASAVQIIMTGLLAAILVFRARIARNREEVASFLALGANLAVLLYVMYSGASLAFIPAEMRRVALPEFMRILTGTLLYFALSCHVRRSEHLAKIMDALVMVGGLMALLGLHSLLSPTSEGMANLMGDHQLFGAFLMILFPMTLVAAFTEKQTSRLVTAQVSAALTGICLLMSGTRTAWIGGGVELVALGVLSLIMPARMRQNPAPRRVQQVIPLLIVLACGAAFVALGGAQNLLEKRLSASNARDAIGFRQKMGYAAGELIRSSPLVGHGLGSYAVYQRDYTGVGNPGARVLKQHATLWENAHNFWLQTGADQGLIGIGLFAGILVTFVVTGIRRLRYLEGGIRRSLLLACLAAPFGFAVDALGNPAWQYNQVAMFLWLMLGVGVACLRPRRG